MALLCLKLREIIFMIAGIYAFVRDQWTMLYLNKVDDRVHFCFSFFIECNCSILREKSHGGNRIYSGYVVSCAAYHIAEAFPVLIS